MRKVYLDHNSTTPIRTEVLEAMLPYLKELFGNPSSIHSLGRETKVALEQAREKVASLLNASASEIYFTSGGTESDNWAIKGVAYALENKGKHIVTSQIEHQAVLESCKLLEKEGFKITYLPVDKYGIVNPKDLEKSLREDTILVSVMLANNEVGTIQPMEEMVRLTQEKKNCFHTDAVQAVGKIPVDVKKLGVDLLSLSGHKIYAPKGVGALYIKKGTRINSLAHGGHHERNRRAGTENLSGIVGLGKACELLQQELQDIAGKLKELSESFIKEVQEKIPDVILNGHPTQRVPNTVNFSFKGVEGESIIVSLDLKGVAVTSGSACTSGALEPSHVLTAMGVEPRLAQSSVRFSFGKDNSMEDVEYVTEILPEIIKRLRMMSPVYAASHK